MSEAVTLALVSVITLVCGVIGWAFKRITNAFLLYINRSQEALGEQSAALAKHCIQTGKEHRQIVKTLKALNGLTKGK